MKFVIVVLFLIVHSQLDDKLIFVMIHFRHGARAPSLINSNIDDNHLYNRLFIAKKLLFYLKIFIFIIR